MSGNGKVTTTFGGYDHGYSVLVQADGKILVVGDTSGGVSGHVFALVRYNTDGTLDTTFDGDGKVTTDFNPISSPTSAGGSSVTLQADGKILVAGASSTFGFALVRYNPDGTLDTTFDRDGKVTTDFSYTNAEGNSVTVQADGKILVAGTTPTQSSREFALVRYNTDGTLDTTFDRDGKVTTDFNSRSDYGQSVTVQIDGKILVAGYSNISSSKDDFALVRYNADGSLDTNFDGDGKVTTAIGSRNDIGNSVTMQSDGKILVAGYSYSVNNTNAKEFTYYDFALVRYNANGTLDTTFSSDGKVTTDIASKSNDYGQSVTVQSNGKILVAGTTHSGSSRDFALVRYNTNGTLDTTFSSDGKVTTDIAGDDIGYSVTVQADGKILMAGYNDDRFNVVDFTLVRYNADGSLDTNFGNTGNTGNSTLIGNASNNTLDGTAGDDTLDGAAGADIMTGFAGDDTYYVDSAKDKVIEKTNGGIDTVHSSISYTLGKDVETLVLDGTGDISGTGNKGNNTITGNTGANTLNGKEGNDILEGGAGADKFVFDSALSTTTNIVDTIKDLVSGTDSINLSKWIFGKYKAEADLASDFVSGAGATAQDASDHFIYDTNTGNLYYDADGSGTKAAVQFATLTGAPTLVASDLHIY